MALLKTEAAGWLFAVRFYLYHHKVPFDYSGFIIYYVVVLLFWLYHDFLFKVFGFCHSKHAKPCYYLTNASYICSALFGWRGRGKSNERKKEKRLQPKVTSIGNIKRREIVVDYRGGCFCFAVSSPMEVEYNNSNRSLYTCC